MIDLEDRLTERVNRARLRLELRRATRPAAVVAAGAAIGVACLLFVVTNVSRTLVRDTYEVRIAVRDATAVVAGRDEVRIKGIPAGTITKVELVAGRPVLTAAIQTRYGPLYRDAHATLRPNTALEDMYLDIVDRGTPAAGRLAGATPLAPGRTDTSVGIEDALDIFRADVRVRFRQLLDNLGNGLDGRGDELRAAFVALAPLLRVAGRAADQLAARGRLMRRLVHNTALLSRELARRDRALRRLVRSGGLALRSVAAGSADLDATLRELPRALAALEGSFAAVRGVLGDVDGALVDLRPVADRLPGGLSELRRLDADAGPAVRALQRPVTRLTALARTLVPLSLRLDDAVGALRPQTGSVDRLTRLIAGCRRPIQGFFQWDASLVKFSDARGGVIRGNLELNATSSGLTGDPNTYFHQSCTPGATLGGRPPTPEDYR